VTIVIPTFNRSSFVLRAVNSALEQSEKCNVLVVDHGSTDETPEVLAPLGGSITYVRRENDLGPIFSWMEGVVRSETEFVKILFDDDYLKPNYVQEVMNLMDEETGFVASEAFVFDEISGKVIVPSIFAFPRTGRFKVSSLLGKKVARIMISPSSFIMRRSDLISGLYGGHLPFQNSHHHGAGPDHYTKLLAMLRYSHFGIVKEPLVALGSHETSITIKAQSDLVQRRNLRSVYDEVFLFYQQLRILRAVQPLLLWAYRFVGVAVRRIRVVKKIRNWK
jgi:glycosyltransferase involved in cell wall biosynthesis